MLLSAPVIWQSRRKPTAECKIDLSSRFIKEQHLKASSRTLSLSFSLTFSLSLPLSLSHALRSLTLSLSLTLSHSLTEVSHSLSHTHTERGYEPVEPLYQGAAPQGLPPLLPWSDSQGANRRFETLWGINSTIIISKHVPVTRLS